jgi:acetyltransferase-like isoleucine patch superfamily enzyme
VHGAGLASAEVRAAGSARRSTRWPPAAESDPSAQRRAPRCIVGKPETGYAVGHLYPGAGSDTVIGPEVTLRAGAILYAGTGVGEATVVGHHTLLRSFVTVGAGTQLGHHLTVERATRIGGGVRCSPGSHVTSSAVLADHVFLGAGIRTVNDRELIWREADRQPELLPPRFERGAKVGSGSTILAGVVIGERALVGAGSVVTRDVPVRCHRLRRTGACPRPPRPGRSGIMTSARPQPVRAGAVGWIAPLRAGLPDLAELDLRRLYRFEAALGRA